MTETTINTKTAGGNLSQWLFNPFQFMAGAEALLLGLVIILLSSFIGLLGDTHFDGVLDIHTGATAPVWFFLAEGVINWICTAVPLFFFGLIVSQSSFRMIDVFGTQALARWPYLITALVMLPDANRRVLEYITAKAMQGASTVTINPADAVVFGLAMIAVLLMLIWMVALMYRGYAVSCNIKGARAIVTFIVSILLAEVMSKIVIFLLVRAYLAAK